MHGFRKTCPDAPRRPKPTFLPIPAHRAASEPEKIRIVRCQRARCEEARARATMSFAWRETDAVYTRCVHPCRIIIPQQCRKLTCNRRPIDPCPSGPMKDWRLTWTGHGDTLHTPPPRGVCDAQSGQSRSPRAVSPRRSEFLIFAHGRINSDPCEQAPKRPRTYRRARVETLERAEGGVRDGPCTWSTWSADCTPGRFTKKLS